MAPKTLDLNAHAKTFADTYAHARRTGADRPLAHRFGLADVLGEIEEIIAKRVETAVAAAKSEAATELRTVRAEHAEELAKLAPRITTSTITADRIVGTMRRYDVTYVGRSTVIRDRVTGRVADFGAVTHTYVAEQARRLNSGDLSASVLIWDANAETLRRRLTRRYL